MFSRILLRGSPLSSIKNLPSLLEKKCISTSSAKFLKEIKITETKEEIVIGAESIPSDRTGNLVPSNLTSDHTNCQSCPLCRLNLRRLQFSDVLILNQFIESTGELMPQTVTGLCARSYKKIQKLVHQAQIAQLLPRPADFDVNGPWDNLNTYFEYPKRARDQPMRIIRKEYWK